MVSIGLILIEFMAADNLFLYLTEKMLNIDDFVESRDYKVKAL